MAAGMQGRAPICERACSENEHLGMLSSVSSSVSAAMSKAR